MSHNSDYTRQVPMRILEEVSKAIVGKEELKEALSVALIAGGHVLIEGLPGTAKSKLGEAFATAIGGEFKRVQLTPDMMPADITGFYIYATEGEPRFVQGPLFSNVVLADELNRTTPRTQSALLEAMGEGQVSIEGITHPLPKPFMVIATQVKFGAEGTYPLTDVQLDRFLLRVLSHYPGRDEERQVVSDIDYLDKPSVSQMASGTEIEELQQKARQVHVADAVLDYILDIVAELRRDPDVSQGSGPRGSIALYKCSRARALLEGRDFVIPDDVKRLAVPVLSHRLHIKPEAEMEAVSAEMVVERALSQVAVPKVEV
ncbi:MAG: MoxR family ATPase [Dehalococcoidia bacterium]|nr:MoxR family ATPase [Dehalococcoidia bacterium]